MPSLHAPVEAAAHAAADAPSTTCARPGCAATASASLSFSYLEQVAVLDPLVGSPPPQAYALCGLHATRTRPPKGWELCDRRPAPVLATGVPLSRVPAPAGGLDAPGPPSTPPLVFP